MLGNNREKEIREAIMAGERALSSLQIAEQRLSSARGWGIFDLLGGGFITGMIKHSKLSDASDYLERAKEDLKLFQKELRDVDVPTELRIDIGGFLTFADFFFDGLIADYMVQSKIANARTEVQDAIMRVQYLLQRLKSMDWQ